LWLGYEYEVVAGGYGKGAIPDGLYNIEHYKSVESDKSSLKSVFINPLTERGWFLPLTPQFITIRYGFGIHPNGNLPGTTACVGLQGEDVKRFWDKWMGTPIRSRPDSLFVITNLTKD